MSRLASNIYFIAGVAVVGGALFGFDISSMSAQLGEQSYKCTVFLSLLLYDSLLTSGKATLTKALMDRPLMTSNAVVHPAARKVVSRPPWLPVPGSVP